MIHALAIIDLSGGANAVGPMTHVYLVEIQFQYLLFTEVPLDPEGQQYFIQFSGVGLFRAEEKVPGDLHGDGAASLALFTGQQELDGRAQDTLVIHSRMLEEPAVFRSQKGLYRSVR